MNNPRCEPGVDQALRMLALKERNVIMGNIYCQLQGKKQENIHISGKLFFERNTQQYPLIQFSECL